MEKVIATSNLTPKFKWWDWQNPLSFIRKVVEQHSQWEVVDEKKELHYQLIKTTFLVIKNKTGVLSYDPYLMIMLDGSTIYIAPSTDYDSSKEWYEQAGTLNNNGNYIRLGASGGGANTPHLVPKISSIILNDYSLVFCLSYSKRYCCDRNTYYSYFNNYLKFEIFEPTDTHSSGMLIQNSSDFYIYANNIWYGKNFNNIFNREGKIDIDKPVGTYHKPNAQGSFNATKKSFYINTKTDPNQAPIWQYVGKSYAYYAYADDNHFSNSHNDLQFYIAEGIYVRTKNNGEEKDYFISALDHQVNESSIVETPHIIEEYNRLQSDFFADPTIQPYYWKLQNSIKEVDGRLPSSEDNNNYYLYSSSPLYNCTIYFTVTRKDDSDKAYIITLFDKAYYHSDKRFIFLITDSNTKKQYISFYEGQYIAISKEFSWDVGDKKTVIISWRKGYTRVYVDKKDMSSGDYMRDLYFPKLYLAKNFGDFSDVRMFRTALNDKQLQMFANNQSVSKSLYTV